MMNGGWIWMLIREGVKKSKGRGRQKKKSGHHRNPSKNDGSARSEMDGLAAKQSWQNDGKCVEEKL
jgi:hypothetical protein